MKIVVAMDSFKGSLTSMQAGAAVKEAALRLDGTAEVIVKAFADGGEGTVEAFSNAPDAETIKLQVTGPLGAPVIASYCILRDTNTAVIEIASACGLPLIPAEERDPFETTTYGVGELIQNAMEKGCRKFIIGLGGSATNDGGAGMLTALGYALLDKDAAPIALGAKGLKDLYQIKTDKVLPELRVCRFHIACDVTNPLCGENGCSAVFGPQKGASPETVADMDCWLARYADIAKTVSGKADKNCAGAGAAGGLGFAFLSFTNASLQSGIDMILRQIRLEEDIKTADLVVTGEGRLDAQTVMGKAPVGIAKLAKKYNKKVIAFSGCVTDGAEACNEHGIDAFFPILREVATLENALDPQTAYKNLTAAAYQVFRLLL